MKLEGIHHVTCITADAPRNVDFYARVLGLRLVKKTVNQDDPTVYHLFYADEHGSAGERHHVLRVSGRAARAGPAPEWCTGSPGASARTKRSRFWADRLGWGGGRDGAARRLALRFSDPEGLDLELAVVETDDDPLIAEHPEIPSELALQGFDGVRAYTRAPDASRVFLDAGIGFTPLAPPQEWESRGEQRGSFYVLDEAPEERRLGGAGTVHHVAWSSPIEEHEAWRERVAPSGGDRRRR